MKLARFQGNRLGLVEGERVRDVTLALDDLPAPRWPLPIGDLVIAHLDRLRPRIDALAPSQPTLALASLPLDSPIANPGKILGAPVNYRDHAAEAKADSGIAQGRTVKTLKDWGVFQKATSALAGPAQGVKLRFPDQRNDHEVELVAVIGKTGTNIAARQALDHVAGYAVGLDMTLRGPEFPGLRKSIDSYAVLGPWLTTADEIADPQALDLRLAVNGVERQRANTREMTMGVAELIEYASRYFTLHPGDLIYTGTPAGVGPVRAGDVIEAGIAGLGVMRIAVRDAG
ncbi:MAG: fumarylacetoacetate hydrolase family protein [Rhodospirillales bacterium]|nr:fumarylacetoacetate hydrolase family protein [Rhodospirillales bacterium]